ncbi:hypothetical protein P8452_36492 [Trifolium repens]|nr:hypothetical protein P8452_36492 [Trifolium repens]
MVVVLFASGGPVSVLAGAVSVSGEGESGSVFGYVVLGFGYVTPPCRKFIAAASGCVGFRDLVLDFGETHCNWS